MAEINNEIKRSGNSGKNNSESYCYMPWEAITITGQGDVKPCCQLRGAVQNVYSDPEKTIQELYNSEVIRKVRASFANGVKSEACSSCWEREEQIGASRRLWFKKKFIEEDLPRQRPKVSVVNTPLWKQMDINLSNRCNLKCRMCGVWGSHKWADDEKKLSVINNKYKRETRPERLMLKEIGKEYLESLIPYMAKVERIDFKGGEPMLAKYHIYFLELLIKHKLHKQVTLHYTTNGTVVNKKICGLFSKFKKVEIVFSIEGTGSLYSYIRGGDDFGTDGLVNNLKVYDQLGNVKIMCNVTVQAYNVPNLKELYFFLYNLPLKNYSPKQAFNCIVNSPSYLSPFVWPLHVRERYADQISDVDELAHLRKKLLSQSFRPALYSNFLAFTKDLDAIRGENYFDIYPELKNEVLLC